MLMMLGGLIAIGIFLMQWTPEECLDRFENIATKTFDLGETKKWTWKNLFRAWIHDHRYNLSPIEKAFQSSLDSSEKLFNPLRSDTKVAVTATNVGENKPCIISNYNGPPKHEEDEDSKSE